MTVALEQNHVSVVDHALTGEFCDQLVKAFEQCSRWHHERPGDWAKLIELDLNSRDSVAMMHNRGQPWVKARGTHEYDFTEDCRHLLAVTTAQAQAYRDRWDPLRMMPSIWSAESFRIKCYRPNGRHEFKLHADGVGREQCSRFVSFLYYLNDSDAGTEFPQLGLTVEARRGRLCMFPPTWTYPHRGLMPGDGRTKYILSTYLHYVE